MLATQTSVQIIALLLWALMHIPIVAPHKKQQNLFIKYRFYTYIDTAKEPKTASPLNKKTDVQSLGILSYQH